MHAAYCMVRGTIPATFVVREEDTQNQENNPTVSFANALGEFLQWGLGASLSESPSVRANDTKVLITISRDIQISLIRTAVCAK